MSWKGVFMLKQGLDAESHHVSAAIRVLHSRHNSVEERNVSDSTKKFLAIHHNINTIAAQLIHRLDPLQQYIEHL